DLADLRRPDGSARHTPTEMTERREQIRAGVTAALEAYQALDRGPIGRTGRAGRTDRV
ncbi:hypothetical protein LCGC14_2308460, partial [marine sediment metagenome]